MPDDHDAAPLAPPSVPLRLYPRLLGAEWPALHPTVQHIHTDDALTVAEGVVQVSRAPGWLLGRILDAAHVPPASDAARVRLAVRPRGTVELWRREFGGRPLVTVQSEAPGRLLAERLGILEVQFRLRVKAGALLFRQEQCSIRVGPLRIPLPGWLSIQIAGRESAVSGADASSDRTNVDVRVTGPTGGLLFSYRGSVRWGTGQRGTGEHVA